MGEIYFDFETSLIEVRILEGMFWLFSKKRKIDRRMEESKISE